jgi:phage-related holin
MRTFFATYFFKFLLFLSIYFAPVLASMAAIGVFIIVDFISGLMVAYRTGESITSKKMRDTIGKSVAYMLAILVGQIFELQFLSAVPVMKIIALFIASAELKSIYENLGKITGLDSWTLIKGYLSQNKIKK